MELFGYLTFVGDLQKIPTQNSKYGNDPYIVREICIHSFVVGTDNGQYVPFARGTTMRVSGRAAEQFNIPQGTLVAVEYGTSANAYYDSDKQLLRANGNIFVNRIAAVTQNDLYSVDRIIQTYSQLKP